MRVFLFGCTIINLLLLLVVLPVRPVKAGAVSPGTTVQSVAAGDYTGSTSCRECHERFYQLWAPSHHGLAMQPYTEEFARKNLKNNQETDIKSGGFSYRAMTGPGQGFVLEKGPGGERKYTIKEVIGGKNVYYFLTPLERGRLQTLPAAYDVRRGEWFDTTASGIRHVSDRPLDWRESVYTFNTACFACHVSQYSLNYDLEKDEYHTTWREPGINCETCHGPAGEHVRVCREAPEGVVPKDLKITRGGRDFTPDQNNANCSTCHAQMIPMTDSFSPGDSFFDHFDLTTLEDPDHHPDGRDLGENYTYTTWLLSPCARGGQLDCLKCHTSSGRFRQKEDPNQACLPCHEQRVAESDRHTRHARGSEGDQCISCHMPMTVFARMQRSDHSMLPPTPAATIEFESPNACNLCHTDQSPEWADRLVRQWHENDYQAPLLYRAGLIKSARERDWSRLPEMMGYLSADNRDQVFTTSLIRLLRGCQDERPIPAIIKALGDPSPLVRGAAADYLQAVPTPEAGKALAKALNDDFRLVRIRTASALAAFPAVLLQQFLSENDWPVLKSAIGELTASFLARPDLWTSHYNLGNFHLSIGDTEAALKSYHTASRLEPRVVLPLVNASIAAAREGDFPGAREFLTRALEIDPQNPEAHFNLGLLSAELQEKENAAEHLELALKYDPQMHQAAYNLCVLLGEDEPVRAAPPCRRAWNLNPNLKYGYTLAFYLNRAGETEEMEKLLGDIIDRWPESARAYLLLGEFYEKKGRREQAAETYRRLMAQKSLSPQARAGLKNRIKDLEAP